MTEFVITGELKSNDKRDLLGVEDNKNEWNVLGEPRGRSANLGELTMLGCCWRKGYGTAWCRGEAPRSML